MLWYAGPAKGAEGRQGLGISQATTPIFLSFMLFLSLSCPPALRGGRGKAEGEKPEGEKPFLLWENRAAARVPASRTPFGAKLGAIVLPAPSRRFCLRDSLRDHSRASSSPLSPLPQASRELRSGALGSETYIYIYIFLFFI